MGAPPPAAPAPPLAGSAAPPLDELARAPLSEPLLRYYRARVAESEADLLALAERIDRVAESHASQHKAWWEVHQRMNEISDLQKALSDSHVYLWDERERCQRLQAELDEFKLQEIEDRRKIQHLLSLVGPVVQDVTYLRDTPPETITLHPHSRASMGTGAPGAARRSGACGRRPASTNSARAAGAYVTASDVGFSAAQPPLPGSNTSGRDAARESVDVAGPHPLSAEGTRVLRTVYLPNEQVDSLLLTIESLRAQLQDQERLSRERISALLEDRRLRMAEERSRRAAEAERLQEVEQSLARAQAMLVRYTKDYLKLKHEAKQNERKQIEQLEALQLECTATRKEMDDLRQAAAQEVHNATSTAQSSSEKYIDLYRQQVSDTERTMGLLRDQHNGLQQALAMRVKELEAIVQRLRQQYRELDERRGLEIEGFNNEVALLSKQVCRLELKAYGRRLMEQPIEIMAESGTAAVKAAKSARNIRAIKARVSALEKAMLISDLP